MKRALLSTLSARPIIRSHIQPTNHLRIMAARSYANGTGGPPPLADKSLFKQQSYINGKWVDAQSGKTFEVQNPANDSVIGTMPEMNAADTQTAIDAAAAALPSFRNTTGRERARMLRKWYQLMVDNADDLAKLITWENGKALADAKGEVVYASNFFEWFSEEAPRAYGDTIAAGVATNRVFTVKEPVGVVGLITPW